MYKGFSREEEGRTAEAGFGGERECGSKGVQGSILEDEQSVELVLQER